MKNTSDLTQESKKRLVLILAMLVLAIAVASLLPGLSPTESITAYAEIYYACTLWEGDTAEVYLECSHCGHMYMYERDRSESFDWRESGEFEDWELETPYCRHCYEGHLCGNCHKPRDDSPSEGYCDTCNRCFDCWDIDKHCQKCCEEKELCPECLEAGPHRCMDCHSDTSHCPECGRCLYPLHLNGEVCVGYGDAHCTMCDEPFICTECCECFFNDRSNFCTLCEMCIDCAKNAGEHCVSCNECLQCTDRCTENEDERICVACCIAAGNHCCYCSEHIDDDWCVGGKDGCHCMNCAEDFGWICSQCERCHMCDAFTFCEECGYCKDCCKEAAESAGCECLKYCTMSDEFEDEEHMCPNCNEHFTCQGEEFCETCGYCPECCQANTDEYGCVCGLCVESSDFEDHICENCGEPSCVRGDLCTYCGLCVECCLEISENDGCTCGMCVEYPDFYSTEHFCESCGAFSCNVDFCYDCELCIDCCHANSKSEGCNHEICVESDDWEIHFCKNCERCKEDCDCGESCCTDSGGETSDVHGTNVPIGTILRQPVSKVRTVTGVNMYDRADNTVTFSVRAYDPDKILSYQWYQWIPGETPEALVNESQYMKVTDETLIFVGGVDTNTLTISVPCDACAKDYWYYCVVYSEEDGDIYVESEPARLEGRHSYEWVEYDQERHAYGCIGCGEVNESTIANHEIGPWHYLYYASAKYGAKLVRSCRVCGGIAQSITTEPLGYHPYHTYIYQPVMDVDKKGNEVSLYHEKVCLCGYKEVTKELHNWSDWVVTDAADDDHKGSKYHDCLVCNYRETVEIPKQTHEHIYTLHSYEDSDVRVYTDSMYHWQYCADPDCDALAFKEEHQFTDWRWVGSPRLHYSNAKIQRYCTVCGYKETKTMQEGYFALVFANADIKTEETTKASGNGSFVYKATAKPPTGYYFDHWEIVSGEFNFVGRYVDTNSGTKEYKEYTLTDPHIEFCIAYTPSWYETLYYIKAICYRYDNDLIVYPSGEYLGAGSSTSDGTVKVESIEEDEFGYRTMTIRLHGYKGGALEVNDTGLPCNLKIIVDKDSTITTSGVAGILGSASGGNITIVSENNASLTIKVNNRDEECYGIRSRSKRAWRYDKITIEGNVHLYIDVLSTNANGTAYGIYSKSWVEILDSAQINMEVGSKSCPEEKNITAIGIYAGKEVQIDTTNFIEIFVTNVAEGKKGQGIKARNIIVDEVGCLCVEFKANVRSAFNVAPTFNSAKFVSYVKVNNGKTIKMATIEPGCEVEFNVGENLTLEVEDWAITEYGTYLVTEDEGIFFSVTPALGYYDVRVYVDGMELKPLESLDGVTKRYVLDMVTANKRIQIDCGIKFQPYASQPGTALESVYSGSEAEVTFRLNNVIDALIDHAKLGGEKAINPKFKAEMDKYSDGDLITNNFTVNRIFLQRYNNTINQFVNTNYSFVPSVVGDIKFNDSAKNIGETVRYRLMIVFDGEEYPSDEFTITWTNNPGDVVVPTVRAVELHIKRATAGYSGGICDGGDAWIRLDSTNACYVFDVDLNKGYACSKGDYLLKWKKEHLLKVAEFDYHTGTLVLYGNGYSYDFDNNGIKEVYDLSNEILAIRASDYDGNEGGFIIDVRADTSIGGNYEEYGYESWRDGKGNILKTEHSRAQEAVILNDTGDGFVRIISSNAKENAPMHLFITRTGGESGLMEMRQYSGINASSDVSIEGNLQVSIFVNIDNSILSNRVLGEAERYGVYTEGNLTIRGMARLSCNLPVYNTSLCLNGTAEGIHAEGEVNLLDDAIVYINCQAYRLRPHSDYYALTAGALNVVGNSSLEIQFGEQIYTAVNAGEVLICTTKEVIIDAHDEGSKKYGFYCDGGTVTVQNPSSLQCSIIGGFDLVGKNTQILFEGQFIVYHMDAHNYMPESVRYYSGVAYTVSVTKDESLDYLYPTYFFKVSTPAPDYYLITEYDFDEEFSSDVRYGDTVKVVASEPEKGFRFDGWEIISPVEVTNVVRDGVRLEFTMPDCDITLRPLYVCTAFDDEPPYFVMREGESLHGELHWKAIAGENLYSITLEYLNENGEWWVCEIPNSVYGGTKAWNLEDESDSYAEYSAGIVGMKSYSGIQKLKIEGEDGDGMPLNPKYTTYRISVFCNSGDEPYVLAGAPFTIDFVNGIHLLASEDAMSPTIKIPSGYIGTEYSLDMSEYVYSKAGMTYEVALGDIGGKLSSDVCIVTIDGDNITFMRTGVHLSISAMENFTYITATDNATGKSFRIPYDLGEIVDSEAYPVIVNGKRAISHNKDDILGDGGSVSYNPTTKTLTLNNANLSELYAETTDGEALIGGYAIMSVQDITIELIGKNTISVSQYSYCVNKPSYSAFVGRVIAIGNVSNSTKWNSYLSKSDTQSITFSGDGSLEITIKGQNSIAIYSLKNVSIDGGDISINAEENGITSQKGSVVVNDGKLTINAKKKSCVNVKSGSGHFQVWGGTVDFNGGSEDYVIALNASGYSSSNYFNKGEIVLKTKSTTYGLSNKSLEYNHDMITYNMDGGKLVQGAPSLTSGYVKMSRTYYVWVNGECFTPDKLKIECGNGTATFNPDTNTLTLKGATIKKGISAYNGYPWSAGIYSEEPLNIVFAGSCKIDLSGSDFYDYDTGAKYTTYGEEEQYRQVYGIYISNNLYGDHGYENLNITLSGTGCMITGVFEGIETVDAVILDGASMTVTNCSVGVSAGDGLSLKSGSIAIDTNDGEYDYAVYGGVEILPSYNPISIFGSVGGDLIALNIDELMLVYGNSWAAEYSNIRILDKVVTETIFHNWNVPTYVWSEDGKQVTATEVCKNDSSHIMTETVDVIAEVSKEATCTELGETTYVSEAFDNADFEVQIRTLADVPYAAHTPAVAVRENEVSATCSQEGSYDLVVYCSICKGEISREAKVIPIDVDVHDFGEWTVTKAPTATEAGEETRYCRHDSSHKETRVIVALGTEPVEIEITAESATHGVDVKSIFQEAMSEGKSVEITVGGISISFDASAVYAIGGNPTITFTMTSSDEVSGEMEGTQKVLNISINGFTAGTSTVTVPFDAEVPENQIAKVYYLAEDGSKTDMHATFDGGTVTFQTTHYSKYVIVFEDAPSLPEEKATLSPGAIAGIVVGGVVFLAAVGFALWYFVFRKRFF